MGIRRQLVTTVLAVTALCGGAASLANAEPASAPIPTPDLVPGTELRVLGGLGGAVEASQELLTHRLRLDAAVRGVPSAGHIEGAILARLLGTPASGLWLRAGYMVQRFHYRCPDRGTSVNDTPRTIDVGFAYRRRWPGGSLVALEFGGERVARAGLYCSDSGLDASSGGARLNIAGQWAFTRHVGLYGRAGVRTGPHVLEIGFLPELWLGLAFEI